MKYKMRQWMNSKNSILTDRNYLQARVKYNSDFKYSIVFHPFHIHTASLGAICDLIEDNYCLT